MFDNLKRAARLVQQYVKLWQPKCIQIHWIRSKNKKSLTLFQLKLKTKRNEIACPVAVGLLRRTLLVSNHFHI